MPSMCFRSRPGPSLPCLTSNRCSLPYGFNQLCHLAVILLRLQRRLKPHRSSGGGQTPSPLGVIGPQAAQGTGPEAGPEAGHEGGRIEGRIVWGLLQ